MTILHANWQKTLTTAFSGKENILSEQTEGTSKTYL